MLGDRRKVALMLLGWLAESLYWAALFFILAVAATSDAFGFYQPQEAFAEAVVLITLDGLRPEEVFSGADQRLIAADNGVKNPEQCREAYWREDREERRKRLLPFLWQMAEEDGWIAGDVESDSVVEVTNGKYFSYPGYNEILSGRADPAVDSNDKKHNKNVTVLEWLHQMPKYRGRIEAFGSWDVFPYILNAPRSGIPVNAGWQKFEGSVSETQQAINTVQELLFREWDGVRYDSLTYLAALDSLKRNQPRVLFVSLGETDDWAHGGRYDRYLLTATQNDEMIRRLWQATQSIDSYSGKTLFLVTTDHGRGDGREGWKNHGATLPGSERIWIAAFGAGVELNGVDQGGRFQQAQVAATLAKALGEDFQSSHAGIHDSLPIFRSLVPE